MPSVTFHGGPCAGTTRTYTVAALADGKVTCGGAAYAVFDNHAGGYFAVLETAIAPEPVTAEAPQAAHAWRRLVHSLVTETPRDLRRASAAGRHMARIGRKA
jgi:hypothetical protein